MTLVMAWAMRCGTGRLRVLTVRTRALSEGRATKAGAIGSGRSTRRLVVRVAMRSWGAPGTRGGRRATHRWVHAVRSRAVVASAVGARHPVGAASAGRAVGIFTIIRTAHPVPGRAAHATGSNRRYGGRSRTVRVTSVGGHVGHLCETWVHRSRSMLRVRAVCRRRRIPAAHTTSSSHGHTSRGRHVIRLVISVAIGALVVIITRTLIVVIAGTLVMVIVKSLVLGSVRVARVTHWRPGHRATNGRATGNWATSHATDLGPSWGTVRTVTTEILAGHGACGTGRNASHHGRVGVVPASGSLQVVHFMGLLLKLDLFRRGTLPTRHLGQRVLSALLVALELGVLGRPGAATDRRSNGDVHRRLSLVALVGRNIRLVKVLMLPGFGGIAAAAAVPAALEASETATAAGFGAAAAANDTGDDGQKNKATDDDDSNDRVLAESGVHAIIPARECSLDVGNLVVRVVDNVSFGDFVGDASNNAVSKSPPHATVKAPGHGNIYRSHCDRGCV